MALFVWGVSAFFSGVIVSRLRIADSLTQTGRCHIAGDVFHVMLVNGEVPK